MTTLPPAPVVTPRPHVGTHTSAYTGTYARAGCHAGTYSRTHTGTYTGTHTGTYTGTYARGPDTCPRTARRVRVGTEQVPAGTEAQPAEQAVEETAPEAIVEG